MGQFCDTARASHRATKDEWPCEDEFLIDQIDGLTIVNASPQVRLIVLEAKHTPNHLPLHLSCALNSAEGGSLSVALLSAFLFCFV